MHIYIPVKIIAAHFSTFPFFYLRTSLSIFMQQLEDSMARHFGINTAGKQFLIKRYPMKFCTLSLVRITFWIGVTGQRVIKYKQKTRTNLQNAQSVNMLHCFTNSLFFFLHHPLRLQISPFAMGYWPQKSNNGTLRLLEMQFWTTVKSCRIGIHVHVFWQDSNLSISKQHCILSS